MSYAVICIVENEGRSAVLEFKALSVGLDILEGIVCGFEEVCLCSVCIGASLKCHISRCAVVGHLYGVFLAVNVLAEIKIDTVGRYRTCGLYLSSRSRSCSADIIGCRRCRRVSGNCKLVIRGFSLVLVHNGVCLY